MSNIAVVTGAGSGVGQAITLMLAERGWNVALIGTRKQTLDETIRLAGAPKAKLLAIPCDVANEKSVHEMAQQVKQSLGIPSVLVNSAGTNVPRRALAELSTEDFRRTIDVNLNGAYFCVHEFLPMMRAAGSGTIVNIISDVGIAANTKSGAAYIASKFGLRGLTQTINAEERGNGIRACAICPGEINTPILEKRPVIPPPEARKKMLQPDDVARAVMLAVELPDRAVVEELLIRPR
jgi:NAD(P)-dependent dehydrogenase (short-subunit alcohol dehydrogenase family)